MLLAFLFFCEIEISNGLDLDTLLFDMQYVQSRYSTYTHGTNLSRQYKKQVKFSMRNFAPVRFLHLAWWVMLFVWMPYDEGKGWVTEWKEREKTTDR